MTIYDIAEQLEVSAATVSLALGDDRRVSAHTRRRVQEFAWQHGYKRNEQARNFRLKRTNNVALVVHNIDNDFWFGVVRAVESALGEGYNVILCNTEGDLEKERKIFRDLLRRRVDGIIIQPASQAEEHLEEAVSAGIPVVSLEATANPCLSFVKGNDAESARQLTEKCLALGHAKIAFLTFRSNSIGLEERLRGFLEAAGSNGEVFVAGELSQQAIEQVFGAHCRDFALVLCSDDRVACFLLKVLNDKKIRVPGELSVIGWNNSRFLEYLTPALSSVAIPMCEVGERAARLILKSLGGSAGTEKCYIEQTIVIRESFTFNQNPKS